MVDLVGLLSETGEEKPEGYDQAIANQKNKGINLAKVKK